MKGRIAAHVAAMVVMGAVAFAGFGFLVEWRQDQPVEVAAGFDVQVAGQPSPIGALVAGVAASSHTARVELGDGDRGRAMHALDAAMRAAMVGRHAGSGPIGWAFDRAVHLLEEARVDVQNGTPASARRHLAEVVDTMRSAADLARGDASGARVPDPGLWDQYEGATILNALGSRIGRLEDLIRRDGRALAELRLGGSHDVLGFLDLGGESVTVPAAVLLYGEPELVGVLHVVVPTFDDDVER